MSVCGDALLFLDAAERSAAASRYEDTERLAVILDAMAAMRGGGRKAHSARR